MATNTGYSNVSASQLSSRVAPPLGHVPPPPPSKPPPYAHLTQLSPGSSYYGTSSSQYAGVHQQSVATPSCTDTTKTVESNNPVLPAETEEKHVSSKTFVDSSQDVPSHQSKERQSPVQTPVTMEKDESVSPEVKYKSDEGLKMKFSGGFAAKKRPNPSIAVQLKPQATFAKKPKPHASKVSVAQAFGSDSDEEDVEEMPRAAKLRMRNIGKDTPTSAGPNSFNKSSKGFTDQAAVFKKQFGM